MSRVVWLGMECNGIAVKTLGLLTETLAVRDPGTAGWGELLSSPQLLPIQQFENMQIAHRYHFGEKVTDFPETWGIVMGYSHANHMTTETPSNNVGFLG